jgi:hypothetical protein
VEQAKGSRLLVDSYGMVQHCWFCGYVPWIVQALLST